MINVVNSNICFTYDNAEKSHETFKTFANNVNTHDGGYHLKGFREALASNLNEFAIENKMINSNLEMKYIMENIYCIISVMLPEAEFEGQTKEKLGNQEVETAIKNIMKNSFNVFKKKNKEDLKLLVEKAIKSKQIDEAIRKAGVKMLKDNLKQVEENIEKACERAGRKREVHVCLVQ